MLSISSIVPTEVYTRMLSKTGSATSNLTGNSPSPSCFAGEFAPALVFGGHNPPVRRHVRLFGRPRPFLGRISDVCLSRARPERTRPRECGTVARRRRRSGGGGGRLTAGWARRKFTAPGLNPAATAAPERDGRNRTPRSDRAWATCGGRLGLFWTGGRCWQDGRLASLGKL